MPLLDTCYLCERPFGASGVLKHEEHIIQNAIGGKLRSRSILCEKCGENLGGSVDAPFIKSIAPLSTILFDLARDRGEQTPAPAVLATKQRLLHPPGDVTFKLNSNFELLPSKPVYIQDDEFKTVTVFAATDKLAIKFCASPAIQALHQRGYIVATRTNIAEYAEKIYLQLDPESPDLLRGVLKIAIEYAISEQIPASAVRDLLPNGEVVATAETLQSLVRQYYPTSEEEKLYEAYKFEHESSYPNHQLYLFNLGKKLYCYVELFGAIQKYVLLSSDYHGEPILKKYLQRCTRWNFDERDWLCRSASDLDVLARQFGIRTAGRPWEDIQKDILDAASQRDYFIDPDEQIEKVEKLVLNLAEYKLAKIHGYAVVDQLLAKAEEAKRSFTFTLADRLHANPLEARALLNRNFGDFRIQCGPKACPEASEEIDTEIKHTYASYKLFEFLMALDKQHILSFQFAD